MYTWKMWGIGLDVLYVNANSFDEAIDSARMVDSRYCAGQIVRED